MANGSAYELGAAFAQLTCILEDAAEQAVEGQSNQADHDMRRRLVTDLEKGIGQASLILKEIKTAPG